MNDTPWITVLTRIVDAIRRLGEILFRRADARARSYGWEVTSSRRGLARSYRDPRFDTLRRCGGCGGVGADAAGRDCPSCSGTGRVVHDPRPAIRGGG